MNRVKIVSLHYRILLCAVAVFFWAGNVLAQSATDTIKAASFSGQSGVTTETCSEGGQDVTSIQTGDYIYFSNIDFGTSGIQCFEARVASYGNGGFIELRLDSQTGTLIGTCEILPPTGGWQTWTSKACQVTGATGVHALYLKFTGGVGTYSISNLFSVNWIKFHGTPTIATAGWRSSTSSSKGSWNGKITLVAASGTPTVQVYPDSMRQRVDGFGGAFNDNGAHCLGAPFGTGSSISAQAREAVLRELYDPVYGCKFNMGRIPVGMSDFTTVQEYSYDERPAGQKDYSMTYFNIGHDTSYNMFYVKEAMKYQPNIMLYASPWTPPNWMKSNDNWQGNNGSTAVMDTTAQTLTAYALYFRKFVQAWNTRGFSINIIYPQNEPLYTSSSHPSCSWPGDGVSMRNFCSTFLWPDFNTNNIGAQIYMGTFFDGNYSTDIQPTLNDAVARTRLTGCGTQRGGADNLSQAITAAKGLGLHWHGQETEDWCQSGANNWNPDAMQTMECCIQYFEDQVNSFNYWNMILDSNYNYVTWMTRAQNSMITINPKASGAPTIKYNPEFYMMKHFSYYVAPGAVSIKSTPGHATSGLSTTAFKNPDGSIVVVIQNYNSSATSTVVRVGAQQFTASLAAVSANTFLLGGGQDSMNWVPKITVDTWYTPPKQGAAVVSAHGIMTVYDLQGRIVKVIDATMVKTSDMKVWDKTDGTGRKAAPGLYFITDRAGKNVGARKVMCQ
jgi:glucosylceramidase